MNPMMMNPMMMGMMGGMMGGMMTPPMGVPMGMPMPMGMPIPGQVPGVPGMGLYNSLPGRFGRDMLGRDFAGPGGVGSRRVTSYRHLIQPYRPPDPSALPPMPFGLPFIARPGQEGFDQYGRMLPPELPEGWDGWGRPLVAAGANPLAPPGTNPPAGPMPGAPPPGPQMMPSGQPQTRDMPITSQSQTQSSTYGYPSQSGSQTGTMTEGTGRPDQYVGWRNYYLVSNKSEKDDPRGYEEIPEEAVKKRIEPPCFDRPPAKQDSYYRYDPFEAFSLSARMLNHPHQLHLPPELISRDVGEEDWIKFIEDLSREALTGARHSFARQARGDHSGPDPVLSEGVHSLLASWAAAFFASRGIRVYAAQDGRKVIPPPIEPPPNKRGFSYASEWSDEESSDDDFGYGSEDEEERMERKDDMYLPRREREIRRNERARIRRRERRRQMREAEVQGGEKRGGWEVHFVPATPTIWVPGARPRTYGEPVVRLRRQ